MAPSNPRDVIGLLAAAVRDELDGAELCQSIIVTSQQEARMLTRLGYPSVFVIGHARTPAPTARAFERRSGMLFVGAIHDQDSPNLDSLLWFARDVLPLVEQALGWETRLTIAGYVAPDVDLGPLARHSRIVLRGPVSNLQPLYDSHRVFVAPTRFGAGSPYKVHEAASFGLPIVATELLRRQLGWTNGDEILSAGATDATVFAAHIVRLYRDEALWNRLRDRALARLRLENDPDAYARAIRAILEPFGGEPAGAPALSASGS